MGYKSYSLHWQRQAQTGWFQLIQYQKCKHGTVLRNMARQMSSAICVSYCHSYRAVFIEVTEFISQY